MKDLLDVLLLWLWRQERGSLLVLCVFVFPSASLLGSNSFSAFIRGTYVSAEYTTFLQSHSAFLISAFSPKARNTLSIWKEPHINSEMLNFADRTRDGVGKRSLHASSVLLRG